MTSLLGYNREAIRVKVKKCNGNQQPEYRKFCVDPQITSFEILQSLLARAFDIKGEFAVKYLAIDDCGQETYLSLLSDWDLDAAFLSASDPCLCLRVELRPFEDCAPPDEWDLVGAVEVAPVQMTTAETKAFNRLPNLILNQVEKTLNTIVQKALNFAEEQSLDQSSVPPPPRHPLTDAEFRTFMDTVGQLVQPRELRLAIFQGGIEPSLRKVVWKHILNVYPDGLSGKERMDYMKKKSAEYHALRDTWKDMIKQGKITEELTHVTNMVRKDVLRTDRHLKFYAGTDENENIVSLFNILTTYSLNHPSVGYCQGLSDLASPLLVTMGGEEAQAYICFCGLMRRLRPNFMLDGAAMTRQFQHLTVLVMHYDPSFFAFLKARQADDLLFCYRWLLLELKREFAFEDALHMLEVLWSSLPPEGPPRGQELPLFEAQFTLAKPPPLSPLTRSRETAYTKVCAIRRRSSTSGHHVRCIASSLADKLRHASYRQNHSLDESTLSSLGSSSTAIAAGKEFRRMLHSLDESCLDAAAAAVASEAVSSEGSPFGSSEIFESPPAELASPMKRKGTVSVPSSVSSLQRTFGRSVSLKELKRRVHRAASADGTEDRSSTKLVKNLNEFWSFASKGKQPLGDWKHESIDSGLQSRHRREAPEYAPITSAKMKELQLQLENLDSKVFGGSHRNEPARDPPPTDSQFVWENPLPAEQEPPPPVMTNSCEEVTESTQVVGGNHSSPSPPLPPPHEFGGGNPFLMFLCLTLLLQHRDHIVRNRMDYNELAMHFDKMVRKHDVQRVLHQARQLFSEYLKQDWGGAKAQDNSVGGADKVSV